MPGTVESALDTDPGEKVEMAVESQPPHLGTRPPSICLCYPRDS
jgi:hypothetical protein